MPAHPLAAVDLSALALELGFFDQAHFTRQFKALVRRTPSSYVRSSGYSARTCSFSPISSSIARRPSMLGCFKRIHAFAM